MSDTFGTRRAFLNKGAAMGASALAASLLSSRGHAAPDAKDSPERVLSVLDFGAKGDGKTDDTVSIQAAINAAIERSGRVHFPAGRYRVTRSLVFRSAESIDITGDGGTSVLLHECDEHLLLWPEEVACAWVTIRDLCFAATGKSKSKNTAVVACLGSCYCSLFSRLIFKTAEGSMGSAVITEKITDTVTFDQCLLYGPIYGTGIRVAQGSEVRIFGGRILGGGYKNTGSIGIHLTGNNGGVYVVSTDISSFDVSVKIGETGQPSNREVFLTHVAIDASNYGLLQVDHTYTSIVGCWAASCDEANIMMDKTALGGSMVISGGTIFNCGTADGPGAHDGVVLRAGSLVMNGVWIRHNRGTGVLIDNQNATQYAITGCRITNNARGASLTGTNFSFTGNVLAENKENLVDNGGEGKQLVGNVLV